MVAIQMISARIGAVSGKRLATNIRECYPKRLLYPLVVSLCMRCRYWPGRRLMQ
jgi:Mn2+/Fe2+ NRAMP family transporter